MLGKGFLQLASYKRSIKEILETKEHYPNWKLHCSEKQFLWETRHFWIELRPEATEICHEESKCFLSYFSPTILKHDKMVME